MSKSYLLPEEISLAKEIIFAVRKYGILNHSDEMLLRNINETQDWIINYDLLSAIELKINEAANNPIKTKGGDALNYLLDLRERVDLQREIVSNPEINLDIPNLSPTKLSDICLEKCPTISRRFMYPFRNSQDIEDGLLVLKDLHVLRPYLEKTQPYLNNMSNTYISTKEKYFPKQIEFSLPILSKIRLAKEHGCSENSIDKAINYLNKGKITSPDHFESVILEIETQKTDFDNIENKNLSQEVSPEIYKAIQEAIQDAKNSNVGLPLADSQVAILAKAEHPILAKELGFVMSRGYASNDVARAILDNVNTIAKQDPNIDYKYLTQAFSLVGQLSKMSAKEMAILGDIMLNSDKELSFYNMRIAAGDVKNMSIKEKWSPSKPKKQVHPKKQHEYSLEDR